MNHLLVASILFLAAACAVGKEYKVVCYFSNWAWFRSDEGRFVPEDIDPRPCTHLHYAFLNLDWAMLLPEPAVPQLDIRKNFYQRVVAMKKKNPELKVSAALGGWGDSLDGKKYSLMVSNGTSRKMFVQSVVDWLHKYDFDGLDLEWIFPVCWQGKCEEGPRSDQEGFASLLQELRTAFDEAEKQYLLSVTVSPSPRVAARAYNASVLATVADYVQVMTYDYHGFWENETGHVAPMYFRQGDHDKTANVESAMRYWVDAGVPRNKLILGLPTFGRSFTLVDRKDHDLGAGARGPGLRAQYMDGNAVGMTGYFEICMRIKYQGWKQTRDEKAGPYAFSGSQWVGYDDPRAVYQKTGYVKDQGFGGVRLWDLSTDDFRALCCNTSYPLLNTVNDALNGRPFDPYGCEEVAPDATVCIPSEQ